MFRCTLCKAEFADEGDALSHLARGHSLIVEIPDEALARGEVLEARRHGSGSYVLQRVQCGKHCKGCPHGPYWYLYTKKDGKTRCKYIGKKAPWEKGETSPGPQVPQSAEQASTSRPA
jgi:hypothetical protein